MLSRLHEKNIPLYVHIIFLRAQNGDITLSTPMTIYYTIDQNNVYIVYRFYKVIISIYNTSTFLIV